MNGDGAEEELSEETERAVISALSVSFD